MKQVYCTIVNGSLVLYESRIEVAELCNGLRICVTKKPVLHAFCLYKDPHLRSLSRSFVFCSIIHRLLAHQHNTNNKHTNTKKKRGTFLYVSKSVWLNPATIDVSGFRS